MTFCLFLTVFLRNREILMHFWWWRIFSNTAVGNYQIPKLVLLDVNVERGTYILSHPEATEELFIKHHDMMFDSDRIIETKIVEASMKLLHLGKSYDTWIQNLFGEEDLKLVYHYSSQPLRPVREKFTPIYPESFSAKDFVMCAFTSQATLITWASIDDVNTKLTEPKNHLRYRCNFTARTLDDEPYQEDHWKNFRQEKNSEKNSWNFVYVLAKPCRFPFNLTIFLVLGLARKVCYIPIKRVTNVLSSTLIRRQELKIPMVNPWKRCTSLGSTISEKNHLSTN